MPVAYAKYIKQKVLYETRSMFVRLSLYHDGQFPVLQVLVGRSPLVVLDTELSACGNLRWIFGGV